MVKKSLQIFGGLLLLYQGNLLSAEPQDPPAIKEGIKEGIRKEEPKPAETPTESRPKDFVPYDFSKYNGVAVFWAPGQREKYSVDNYASLKSPKHEELSAALGPILEGTILSNSKGLYVNATGDVVYKSEPYNLIFYYNDSNGTQSRFPVPDQKILRAKFSEQARKLLGTKKPEQASPSQSTTGGGGLGYKPPWGETTGYKPPITRNSTGSSSATIRIGDSSQDPLGSGVTPDDPSKKPVDNQSTEVPVSKPPAPGFKELSEPVLKRLEDASKKIQPQQTWQDAKAFIQEHLPRFENIRTILSKSDGAFSRRLEEEIEKSRVYLGELERSYLRGQVTPPKLITELITNSDRTIKILHKVYWEMAPENKAYTFLYALMRGLVPENDPHIKELKAIIFSQSIYKHEEQMKGDLVAIDKKTWDLVIRSFVNSAQTLELDALTDEMVIYRDRVKAKLGSILPSSYLSELNEVVLSVSEAAKNSYLSDHAKVFGGESPSNHLQTKQLELIVSIRKLVAQKVVEEATLDEKLQLVGLLIETLQQNDLEEDQIRDVMDAVRKMKEKKTDNNIEVQSKNQN